MSDSEIVKLNIKTLSRILSFCQSDKEIANVVSVIDMLWARDAERSVIGFNPEDITLIAQAINNQRTG